jgi:predicted metal-binding membrane protein
MPSSRTCTSRPTVSSAPELTTRIVRHERLIVAFAIAFVVALCCLFLARGAGMGGMAMIQPPLAALVLMWWAMMAAMMLPSAAPAILLYARVRESRGGDAVAAPVLFASGYLLIWLAFSVLAAAAQWLLGGQAMSIGGRFAQSGMLIAAGLYQLSPLKSACLRQCRSPAQFLSRHWRPGVAGAVRLGQRHGAYCVGCCWLLMALLFVGGVMSFAWIVALAALVAIEKLVPRGALIGRAAGLALIGWGAVRIAAL